jgi:hypothetical protein
MATQRANGKASDPEAEEANEMIDEEIIEEVIDDDER